MLDALIVGAGPAGTVAATVLARAGARVRIVDRARFPRDKLCGDTVNPGTLTLLRRLEMAERADVRGLPIDGMIVTGADGVAVAARYPHGLQGRAIVRRELDWSLLQRALAAGADFDPWTTVRRVTMDHGARPAVTGVIVNDDRTIDARLVIGADGRHSTLAFGLGLARHPGRPRRWAIGAYFENVAPPDGAQGMLGEMHVRSGGYIGVAPVPGGLINVCLVRTWEAPDGVRSSRDSDVAFRDPELLLRRELARDGQLRERFAAASIVTPPVVLGPLAVDVDPCSIDGLLFAGDASGFVDPVTGDGLRFAVKGGELAARAALQALEHGWSGVQARLSEERRREFSLKWRFNRALRTIISSRSGVRLGEAVASLAPSTLRAVVRFAGDCSIA